MKKPIVELVCSDCKVHDIMDAVQTALKTFGIFVTPSPAGEESDSLVFYLSNYKLGEKALKELDKDYGVDPFEDED